MASEKGEVLMKLVLRGQAVQAGGSSLLKDDMLALGFSAGKFFEIDDFDLNLGLKDFEAASGPGAQSAPAPLSGVGHSPSGHAGTSSATAPQKPDATPPRASGFASWRDTTKDTAAIAKLAFPVESEPFSVTRLIDRASPLLFESCASTTTFDTATIVKRRLTGQAQVLQTFLRIDFKSVLIVGLNWSDGGLVKETVRFISRGVAIQYRPQTTAGALGAVAPASWDQSMALRTAPAKG